MPSTAPGDSRPPCKICGANTVTAGEVAGKYSGRAYHLRQCVNCGFGFVADPWTDFAEIYDERYYAGRGADPLVDYEFELTDPELSVRQYEWRGLGRLAQALIGDLDGVRWLDFGCGNGGLVRYLRAHRHADAVGFEEGSIAEEARRVGIPVRDRGDLGGGYDIVSAIEVLEHTLDPVAELTQMRQLLRPGGLLIQTTGNSAPFADRLAEWNYVIPEIHVSFFNPRALSLALTKAGFRPVPIGLGNGFEEVLKFKVLKNLHLRRRNAATDLIPAGPLGLVADRRTSLSSMPIGWAGE